MKNLNKHILLVMKWLDNKDSVTQEELEDNLAYAACAAYAPAAYAAYAAAAPAAYAAAYAADTEFWVGKYFKYSGENKQDYIDALKGDDKPVYTQAMANHNILPLVGMEVLFNDNTDFDCKFDFVDGDLMVCMCHSTDIDGESIGVYHHKCGVTISLNLNLIKPLAPPIELIDGKAYQFDYKGVHIGLYNKYEDEFFGVGINHAKDICTNIKPLTVEGE